MNHEIVHKQDVSLPLFMVLPGYAGNSGREAKVQFKAGRPSVVQFDLFSFEQGTIKRFQEKSLVPKMPYLVQSETIPYFSVTAVILLIIFRNLFYSSFRKYFLSFRLNYEIDLSPQKIGVPPLLISIGVIYFSLLDFLRLHAVPDQVFSSMKAIELLTFSMVSGFASHLILSASPKIFPLFFPDLKVVFLLSLLLVVHNFVISSGNKLFVPFASMLPFYMAFSFLFLRSILYFGVFRKYFRYRRTLSIFYICTQNLVTCLIMHRVLF